MPFLSVLSSHHGRQPVILLLVRQVIKITVIDNYHGRATGIDAQNGRILPFLAKRACKFVHDCAAYLIITAGLPNCIRWHGNFADCTSFSNYHGRATGIQKYERPRFFAYHGRAPE